MEENKHSHQPQAGHEGGDVDAWAVGKFAIGLAFITILSMTLVFGLYRFFESQHDKVVSVDPVKVFPEPRLQQTPMPDLKAVHDAEDQLLTGYAWVDPKQGLVRIPIDKAIDVLARKGLPSRAPAAASAVISMPTESGLGVAATAEPAASEEHKK